MDSAITCRCDDLTLLLLDAAMTWLSTIIRLYYYLTLRWLDSTITCRCDDLTLLSFDYTTTWLYYSVTLLFLDAAMTWLYYYLTIYYYLTLRWLDCLLLFDSTITWRCDDLTLLLFDAIDTITWCCDDLTLLLFDAIDTITWLCDDLTLLLFDSTTTTTTWRCDDLTLLIMDSAITWRCDDLTLLLFDAIRYYYLTLRWLDSTIIWRYRYLTLLLFDCCPYFWIQRLTLLCHKTAAAIGRHTVHISSSLNLKKLMYVDINLHSLHPSCPSCLVSYPALPSCLVLSPAEMQSRRPNACDWGSMMQSSGLKSSPQTESWNFGDRNQSHFMNSMQFRSTLDIFAAVSASLVLLKLTLIRKTQSSLCLTRRIYVFLVVLSIVREIQRNV